MNATQPAERGRVHKRYNAADRERLIQEQARSGLTKTAFCAREGIALPTFHSWGTRSLPVKRQPAFAQVELPALTQAAVEVLPSGTLIASATRANAKVWWR
jgi:hypothetical protein